MTEPWPPAPVGVSGSVVLKLLGMKLATIRLDLVIYAAQRLARWVEAGDQAGMTSEGLRGPARADRRFRPRHEAGFAAGSVPARPSRTASIPAPRREGGRPRPASELPRDGGGPAEQGELREILQLLAKTSKMLE